MQTSRLLLAAGCLLLVAVMPGQAASIPGIVSIPGEGLQPSAGAESEDTVNCLAVVYPYSTWQPNTNSSARLPTPSPPPSFIEGSIDFALINLGSNPIEAPWTLGIYNPLYSQVLQVWNFDFLNATQGQVYGNASAAYETLLPQQNNSVYLGILVQASQNNIQPLNITINGQQCKLQLVNNITGITPLATTTNSSQSRIESAEQPVSISNGVIIGVDGEPTPMKAINYFGFNNGATMFDGLYAGSNSLTQDFGLSLYRLQALGFNCVRVPFSFQSLFKGQPNSFTKSCNAISQSDLRANLSPPNVNIDSSLQLPGQVYPEGNDPTICNQLLPNDSVYNRFLYIIQFLVRNNMYVLIDDHSEDPTVQNDPNQWVLYWTQLMTDIQKDVPSRNRVMVDLLNEPDHAGYKWDQLGTLYLAAMDAIYATPNGADTLFFVEGTGQLGLPGLNWGDGFVTDQTLIGQYGLSDPNSFFQTVLTKPYLNNVGVSPHIYPPSVTYATQGFQGDSLWFRMYNSFGYLNTVGYGGHLFPVFVGEIGSKFESATDITSLNDMQAFFLAKSGTGTTHNPIPDIAYWDYNANSGDTGGIVDDSWVNVLWVKIEWLIATVNLQPWYLGNTPTPSPTPTSTPSPSPSPPPVVPSPPPVVPSPPPVVPSPPPVVPSPPPVVESPPPVVESPPPSSPPPAPVVAAPQPSPAPPPTPTPAPSPPPSPSPTPAPSPPPTPSPTPVSSPPPSPTPSPSPPPVSTSPPPPATPPPSGGSCEVYSQISNPWSTGTGAYSTSVNLYLKNTGSSVFKVPYSLNVTDSTYTNTQYSWNWDVTGTSAGQQNGIVQTGEWQTLTPAGNIVNVGAIIDGTGNTTASFAPTKVVVAGITCKIVPAPNMAS